MLAGLLVVIALLVGAILSLYNIQGWKLPGGLAVTLLVVLYVSLVGAGLLFAFVVGRWWRDRSQSLNLLGDRTTAHFNQGSNQLEITQVVESESQAFDTASCVALIDGREHKLQPGLVSRHMTIKDRYIIPFTLALESVPTELSVAVRFNVLMRNRVRKNLDQCLPIQLVGAPRPSVPDVCGT